MRYATDSKRCCIRMISVGLALLFSFFVFNNAVLADTRLVQDIDCGWRFILDDNNAFRLKEYNDSKWRTLNVPHDWSIEGEYNITNPTVQVGAYLPSGVGWYRREFQMPDSWSGRVVNAEFDGIYMDSEVWLNGERVGSRSYGYISFNCNLSKRIQPGPNVIAVRVDNSREPSARWYHGCGIYGHVRLIVTDPVHVPQYGVFVTTPVISNDSAVVRAAIEVRNASGSSAEVEVRMDVVSPGGSVVASAKDNTSLPAGDTGSVTRNLDIPKPLLWSLETPSLYTLKTSIVRAGKVVDEMVTPFGIRSIRFDPNTGFYLNGRNVKLKGVCEHQGGSPVGAAMPEQLMERRLKQLKAMGCNAIRVSHNPQLPYFYDMCDRMGFLVMDEIFDGWHEKADHDYGGRYFEAEWQRDVTDWIRRDRNHPSVIFWSIGNETGKTDVNKITKLIHSLDTTRPTTGGAVIYGVDVAGFNGGIVEKDAVLLDFHRDNPSTPIVMTEEPHTFSTRGFYRTMRAVYKDIDKLPNYAEPEVFLGGHTAYRSSYDNCGRRLVARNCWKRTIDRPWVMGEFRWTGFDYLGESGWSGEESLARAFNFGVIDLAGFPKDHYYFYQSIWTETPMVHILPHWTHPGLEGKKIPVVAYANAEEIELFQDGKSLGRKPRSELFECVWQVPYKPGELKAVAYRGGKALAEAVQRTAGSPSRLQLTTDNAALNPDRTDLALVSMAVLDDRGILVPDADSPIAFALTGPASYLGGENGDPVDNTAQKKPWRKAFAGLARAFYSGQDGSAGDIEVTALGILGKSYFPDTAAVPVVIESIALRGKPASKKYDIRYTLDGSEPGPVSALYKEPLLLTATTTIRATAFVEGKPFVSATGTFNRGVRPVWISPYQRKLEQGVAEDPSHEKTMNKTMKSGK